MPPSVVATLQAETAKALRDPKIAERMVQLGVIMRENGTAHYQKYIADDIERYAAIVKKLNLQIK
jgi:tripartite-type tricarboxylate transporter receptor subunit TctC